MNNGQIQSNQIKNNKQSNNDNNQRHNSQNHDGQVPQFLNVMRGDKMSLFNYNGINVKHFIRSDYEDWSGNSVSDSVKNIENTIKERNLKTYVPA